MLGLLFGSDRFLGVGRSGHPFFPFCLGEVLGVCIASHLCFLFWVWIMRRRWGTCAGVMHESPCTIHTHKNTFEHIDIP